MRVEIALAIRELLLQMRAGKFEGDELVMIAPLTRCGERFIRDRVIAGVARKIIDLRTAATTAVLKTCLAGHPVHEAATPAVEPE